MYKFKLMKTITQLLLTTVFFACIQSNAQSLEHSLPGNWLTNLEKAQQKAKNQKKNILLYFSGSDWCGPCKKLQQDFFSKDAFKKQASDFVLVLIDIPRREDILLPSQKEYNKGIMNRLNTRKAFPLVAVLNSKGRVLEEIAGYSGTGNISFYEQLLNNHSR